MTKKKTIPEAIAQTVVRTRNLHQDDVYHVSTEYDESDDLEAAKKIPTESEIMQQELEPIQEEVLKGPKFTEDEYLARKQRGLQTD